MPDSPLIRANFRQRHIALASIDTIHAVPTSLKTELPLDLLGVFVRHYDTGDALPRVPLFAVAQIGVLSGLPEPDAEAVAPPLVNYPLGLLGTDHVGYASFDLSVLRHTTVADTLAERLKKADLIPDPGEPPLVVGLVGLFVFPFADPLVRIDALKDGDRGPRALALRIELDAADLVARIFARPMAAMQNPSIDDWRLSPSSFSISGATLVGEDGCESFLPANLSTQQFRFHQVARTTAGQRQYRDGPKLQLGRMFHYQSEWFAVGHSLGQVQYSLPLAPGEKVNIAIVDWSRQDRASRAEETDFKESLVHAWTRDRTVSETVHSLLDEWQRGGSVMGGAAASGSTGAYGGSVAVGGGYTTSSGTRELTTDTTQRIADAFHQTSTAMRELRSTVVVQQSQAEKSEVQTRVVANYNHSHALTLLYYEVLRHYRVVTRLTSERPVLFVDYSERFQTFVCDETKPDEVIALNRLILDHRRTLEAALLDERVRGCFDALQRLECLRVNFRGPPTYLNTDDFLLSEFLLKIKSGTPATQRWVSVRLLLKDGDPVDCYLLQRGGGDFFPPKIYVEPPPAPAVYVSTPASMQTIHAGAEDWLPLHLERHVRWGNVAKIEIWQGTHEGSNSNTPEDPWTIESVHACANAESVYWVMFNGPPPWQPLPHNGTLQLDVARYVPAPHSPEEMLTDDERCCIQRLKRHLSENSTYYSRATWYAEDLGVRARRFEKSHFNGALSVLDVVENTIVDIVGDWVAFPVGKTLEREVHREFRMEVANDGRDDFLEQLLTLPTRGVFAEAKLGHCNASEIIDTTRFWDWQTSPIPDSAPQITGADAGSRHQDAQGLAPSPFPNSLVNIVNPANAPDPTGMAAATNLFSAMGGFRDMSAAKEVGALLQTLSNNATGLASQAAKGQQTKTLIDQIRGAPEIPAPRKADLIGQLLTGQVQAQGQQQAQAQTQQQTQQQAQQQAQQQNQQQTGAQAQVQNQNQAQQQNQGQQQGQFNTQVQGQGQAQGQGQGQGQVPAPKPTRTERPLPGKIRIVIIYQNFQEVGSVRSVWGTLQDIDGVADGLPNGPPYGGMTNHVCEHVTKEGSLELFVQLADNASTLLKDATPYKPDASNKVTLHVKPKTAEVEVEDTSEIHAKAEAELKFSNTLGGEVPIRIVLLKVEEVIGVSVGGEVGGSHTTRKKFKYLALRKGLDFS